jgi:GABA permease
MDAVKERAEGGEVLVVAPALNSRLRHLFADVDKAREAAEGRLHESLKHLDEAGIKARGAVGDTDPVRAMGDALFEFDADEIIISTHPPGRSNWMEKGVVERAREETDVPITHVVVDLEAGAAAS